MATGAERADWTDVAQAAAAIVGIAVALGLGIAQFVAGRLAERRRRDAYLTAAVAAAENAEMAVERAEAVLGGMQKVSRRQIEMSYVIHELEATEKGLASFPLHDAPSGETVYALMGALRIVRLIGGHLQAFLADPKNSEMSGDFSDHVRGAVEAAQILRREKRRLVPRTLADLAWAAWAERVNQRELRKFVRDFPRSRDSEDS